MNEQSLTFKDLGKNPLLLLAFGFGSGLSPKAPGTAGTLLALVIFPVLAQLPLWGYLLVLVVAFIAGIYICQHASQKLGVHDHGGVVWDEFVGYWIAMTALPCSWQWILAGFILFRLFDIAKPWPIKWADSKVSGGLGVMLDDVIAGLFSWIILYSAYIGFFR